MDSSQQGTKGGLCVAGKKKHGIFNAEIRVRNRKRERKEKREMESTMLHNEKCVPGVY